MSELYSERWLTGKPYNDRYVADITYTQQTEPICPQNESEAADFLKDKKVLSVTFHRLLWINHHMATVWLSERPGTYGEPISLDIGFEMLNSRHHNKLVPLLGVHAFNALFLAHEEKLPVNQPIIFGPTEKKHQRKLMGYVRKSTSDISFPVSDR